ncbi:23S rRNA (guanosine(2251)-2'-O)-methyltransferase RlmB [uncultured Clostridium sp.]|jgi:23S rRNA (guanosine2251-2'-O)-methyltransferase|uniref:23S rRNA (guanosine(2251)-2'-O)-methyltransferase RlmB n=1 Tax=Clostridium sp. TaxID=1506 RepID=UPI0025E19308|nr:23S rRNA (guanosine(2251)-2'-O)-methyltransferase RlmB [uncultured Clostridium sp.]
MTKRENPRRREREFNKFQEKSNRGFRKKDENQSFKRETRIVAPAKETNIDAIREDLILGRNAVIEALKSDRTIECLYVSKGDLEGSIKVALGLAKDKGIVVKEADRRKLDTMCEGLNHQGIVAKVTPFKYCEVNDILEVAEKKGEKPFIVILDEIEDPHNLGSIIRTAELCGVHGIIIPKRRNVGVTSTVYKCSAGAIEHMKIAKVTNINATIDMLKEKGIWIYGADIEGKDYSYNTDFSGPCALIIGSEGKGISNLTLKKCDLLVKIPMIGKINSLNASVAGGIMMYEVLKGRLTK